MSLDDVAEDRYIDSDIGSDVGGRFAEIVDSEDSDASLDAEHRVSCVVRATAGSDCFPPARNRPL